ncbi:sensor histidine kinase [Methanocella sp. MCL-LM]|uniref:sensor histidine kinase n=1 Tax=Methanocella sp. MCL-LM TaxID=3412035 RepID=UPI003C74EA0E
MIYQLCIKVYVAFDLNPIYILNILISIALIIVGYMVYKSNKNQVALYIAIGFAFYFVSNALSILGFREGLETIHIAARTIGFLAILLGLYVSWKQTRTQVEVLSEKNRQLESEICERNRHRELREQAEEKYRIVFDNALVAMSIVEEDLTISFSNSECEKIMGYTREEVVGRKRITDFLDPRDFDLIARNLAMRRNDPASVPNRYEVRLIDKNGAVRNILLNIAIIPGTRKMVVSFLDITERRQAEDRIKASLLEKEVLLKEVHHRVKNNLQIISSLLSLQAGKIIDSRDVDLFKESQSRVRSMALVHEKLYRSEDLSLINLQEYVEGIIENLNATYGVRTDVIKTTVDIRNLYINLDKGIPCGLIINELVTNCYKHAFPDGRKGEVAICMSIEAGNYVLTVTDNGVGLPDGFDVTRLSSLGIQLISTLTAQLRGTISITAEPGSSFKIVFPE